MSRLAFYLGFRCTLAVLVLSLGAAPCFAQSSSDPPKQQADDGDQQIPPAIAKQLDAMRKRIDELEAELKASKEQGHPDSAVASAKATVPSEPVRPRTRPHQRLPPPPPRPARPFRRPRLLAAAATNVPRHWNASAEAKVAKVEPFSDADWTWLNGNPRTKEIFWDSKFFTPEIRADTVYVYDFNHPTDHSMGGSSELFRSQEVQLTQLGIGGDFHYDNVRARMMTQFGMYSATTPRNDPSPGHGQWDLVSAYRYLSEAYGGYHFDKLHGVNVDAGIFLVIHRIIQLLQIRQLGVSAVIRFVEYAMVL